VKCSNPVALREVAETLHESCSVCLNFRTLGKLGMKLKYPQTLYQAEDQIYGYIYCLDIKGRVTELSAEIPLPNNRCDVRSGFVNRWIYYYEIPYCLLQRTTGQSLPVYH
jgi:hypothetical protein